MHLRETQRQNPWGYSSRALPPRGLQLHFASDGTSLGCRRQSPLHPFPLLMSLHVLTKSTPIILSRVLGRGVTRTCTGTHLQAILDRIHRAQLNRIYCSAMTLRSAKIIGDIVNDVIDSGVTLEVDFNGTKVQDNTTLRPAQAASTPRATLVGTHRGSGLYTIIATDPDPPNPEKPIYREWLHWLVTNVPGGPTAEAANGTEVTPYMGPAPPVGTHRYAFLAFKQPSSEPIHVRDPSHGEAMGRKHFNTREFAKEYGLGDPVAATYFFSHK